MLSRTGSRNGSPNFEVRRTCDSLIGLPPIKVRTHFLTLRKSAKIPQA